jgi:hypothetical protein
MFALLLACTVADTPASVEKEKPLPYIYAEETEVTPSVDVAAVEEAAAAGIIRALQLRAPPVFPAYKAAMAASDAQCPNYYDYNGSVYWYDNCQSEGGSEFAGYSFYTLYDHVDDGAGSFYTGEALSGVSAVETPEGHHFEAGGNAVYYRVDHAAQSKDDTDYSYWISSVQGSFSYDGPEAEGSWLAEDVAPDLTYSAAYLPSQDGRYAVIDGSVGGLEGDISYLVFDGLTVWSPEISTCPEEPGGGFSVRGADGYWYDVTFDGATDWGQKVAPADCDGCGRLWFEGEELGTVCADFSTALAWGDSPW